MTNVDLSLTLTFGSPISIILGIVFIILGIIVLITAKGLLSNTSDDLQYAVFGRLEILGIVDMVSVLILILLGEPALGVVYFILAPFATHAIASGHYRGEQGEH
jgi:energy-converting hydrogenase B subunit C